MQGVACSLPSAAFTFLHPTKKAARDRGSDRPRTRVLRQNGKLVFETISVDDVLQAAIVDAVAIVGAETWLSAPQVTFDARCFPDTWSPTLEGVHTALRRFFRHAGMADVPVVVQDERAAERSNGPVVDPVAFCGIQDGRAHFAVFAVGEPEHLAAWLCIEVVRAWAEHRGVTREEPLAYRAIPTDELPPQPEAVLDASSATVIAIGLGLGPVLAAGSVQSHKSEKLEGAWVQTQWSHAVVGGFPPPVLARLVATYAVSRDASDEEREILRESLPPDVVRDFDSALDELGGDATALRTRVGLPAIVTTDRRPLDLSPLGEEVQSSEPKLKAAERAFEERQRFFNRGRKVFRVPHDHQWIGAGVGLALAGLATGVLLTPLAIVPGLVTGAAFGALAGRRFLYLRCSDPECAGRPGIGDRECPGCGGTIAGEIASAAQRLDAVE
jgi:hypothetical protein